MKFFPNFWNDIFSYDFGPRRRPFPSTSARRGYPEDSFFVFFSHPLYCTSRAAGWFSHPFHIVRPSPWPFCLSLSILAGVLCLLALFSRNVSLFPFCHFVCFFFFLFLFFWFTDIVFESSGVLDAHTERAVVGFRYGIVLFIVSEVMFFFSLFWAFFHGGLNADVLIQFPPEGVMPLSPYGLPVLNTVVLLSSGIFITAVHRILNSRDIRYFPFTSPAWFEGVHRSAFFKKDYIFCVPKYISGNRLPLREPNTWFKFFYNRFAIFDSGIVSVWRRRLWWGVALAVVFGLFFVFCQYSEYCFAPFSIRDGFYGSIFFTLTGFHGFHVIVGTVFLAVICFRIGFGDFTNDRHFAITAAFWYWHFVDVVWLFLFLFVYCWVFSF